MKFSEHWLREWVNPPLNTHQLAEQLTMAGLEVESVLPVAGDFSKVVIGKVLSTEQHPDAERLRVCQVDVGQAAPLTIVCGGANVRADLKVPVVVVGGSIKGQEIKAAKLRGIASQGMICSVTELGLQETSQGIMELPADAPIGEDFRQWLQLNDHSLDLHITPNRGDCLSIAGVAREVAVLNDMAYQAPERKTIATAITDKFPITVDVPADCPRYFGRIIREINPHAITPIWMIERLRRSGLRSIHPVVDVTNYVLLELGQPLHAFDLDKLSGGIHVRRAHADETLILLDEQEVSLNPDVLVIADKQKAQALAGVMGGLESSVTTDTNNIFLESAFFNPLVIAGQARRMGVSSDGAYRFERGVDPELAAIAMERATELLLQIVGGKVGPIVEVVDKKHLPKAAEITLRKVRIERVLGVTIPEKEIETILHRLGMQCTKTSEGWLVHAPSHRFDISIEADLIEELARIRGYQTIPLTRPHTTMEFLTAPERKIKLSRLRDVLIDRGYHEAITYSFIAPKLQQLIDPGQAILDLVNPISADLSVMRTSLLPGLLTAVAYNQNRQQMRVRLFETGLRYLSQQKEILQQPMLAGVVSGDAYTEQWGMAHKPVDFFDVKADLQALFTLTGEASAFSFVKAEHAALHPGQSAGVERAGKLIGYVGAVHPALLQQLDLTGSVFCFELQLDAITMAKLAQAQAFSKFPAIRRDISFWVDASIPVEKILAVVRNTAGELLTDASLFDVYQDKRSTENTRSLALGLLLQHPTRTLVDNEVNDIMERVLKALKQEFAIVLRD